jgi:dTDP-4-amino-4,6-dideoxygalactose transaminase
MSFDTILKFERELAKFTGAPYAIMTDCCTHAIEMCLRHDQVQECAFTPFTYLSIPMTMHKLGIKYSYLNEATQTWTGEYQFIGTRIWDSARRLEQGMYREGTMQCLSFGHGKPLAINRGGAILIDDVETYDTILQRRYDGRDLTISPWPNQMVFKIGYHYKPTIEEAKQGLVLLDDFKQRLPKPVHVPYPDLRQIRIID